MSPLACRRLCNFSHRGTRLKYFSLPQFRDRVVAIDTLTNENTHYTKLLDNNVNKCLKKNCKYWKSLQITLRRCILLSGLMVMISTVGDYHLMKLQVKAGRYWNCPLNRNCPTHEMVNWNNDLLTNWRPQNWGMKSAESNYRVDAVLPRNINFFLDWQLSATITLIIYLTSLFFVVAMSVIMMTWPTQTSP